MSKLFQDFKEQKKTPQNKDKRLDIAQDFEKLKKESIAYFALMKRVSDLRDEAHLNGMLVMGEPIGMFWKAKLEAFDEVLGIPEDYLRKAIESQEESKIRSLV